ncbi:phosphoenolpyruvate--protein phosphotransferase [Ruminococcus sp. Marseille-P6503]|uniref:phosphoenolpyruvate--protein phosphotransferase n=1 Tax=Ruminococcus sp. Marseille-P6503 TaxID=2364796 RepID=UPI000F54B491|nr:phosphoenolpyruvate--protein phosphotransferase [Ruminococcus sp. Marseille-P6503]
MIKLKGKSVLGGIVSGKIVFYSRAESVVEKRKIDNPDIELQRYEYAKSCALSQLKELYNTAVGDVGKNDAGIFLIQQMLINDIDFNKAVRELIMQEHYNADYAVAKTARDFSQVFSEMDSDYIKERSADLKDVCDRLIRHIQNKSESGFNVCDKAIICADDLVPSETVRLDKSKVAAFCTCYGSSNSHTAILARTMNIPAIIGIGNGLLESYNGCEAVVDGYSGILYIEPDSRTRGELEKKRVDEAEKKELLKCLKGKRNITLDGTEVKLFANIGGLSDIDSVIENDAGGIGLFRSEFLYLENDDFPDEEYQFYNYRRVLEQMDGKRVIIRTMDIGADKNISYFGLEKEQNPALGLRSIRLCLERPEMFKTQLRALLRASAYGRLSIMLPMITDAEEIRRTKALIEETKRQLDSRNQSYSNDIELGVMIETPAAAIMSDRLAQEADFFSIGTNDLEQYTLAMDRHNLRLESYGPDHHTALLRLMKITCDNAHRYGRWVGICGEFGGDMSFTEVFLAIGIDEISAAPSLILPLRDKIRKLDISGREEILRKYGCED